MNEHKELELKYLTNKDFNISTLLNLLTKNGFSMIKMQNVTNTDMYFDTPNKDLLKDGASLRIRIVNNKPYGTLKYPVNKDNNYCERIEIEKEIEEEDFNSLLNIFNDIPYDISNVCPKPTLSIINHRYEIYLKYEDVIIALANDDVTYKKDNEEEHETMIEIEIKEGLNYKLLDNINDLIINNLGLIPTKENKYKRGLSNNIKNFYQEKSISNVLFT